MWIDRRIDPQQPLNTASTQKTLANIVDQSAAACGGAAVAIDSIVYVGPVEIASVLPEYAATWRKKSPATMHRKAAMEWRRLTTPRELVEQIADETGLTIEAIDRIPHDLLPAGKLPRMKAGDRLLLLCVGFDLCWKHDTSNRNQLRLAPISVEEVPAQLRGLEELIKKRAPVASEMRYTLRVQEQPLEPLLKQLATQLGCKVKFSSAVEDRDRMVSLDVREATVEELFKAIVVATGLDVEIENQVILVTPSSK